ncbi:hypothetical protein B0J13DRAFT_527533 [Dactylonectria estremocensis]|uniref:Uncharacterized protein n=1 Tax=Dactylonectria estremocensis TaxID=1079267 RepID=A0A9P9EMQ6_9HYPO|nr:hypothetical protein B0J13DRAFT_527533 [Dactylonectria estremocensis]
MSPKEKPSFYLYSNGYSPERITLGSLVFRNYANPDHRCVSLPQIDENELVSQKLASITNVNGCWATTKSSKYGLGVQALDFVSVTSTYARSLQKIILAEKGRRVVLNDPEKFFEDRVLQNPDIRKKLAIWLTTAKGSYVLRKATFQKPKIYCVTGRYELTGVRARISSSSDVALDAVVSPEVIGAASGIPIGLQIGPFSDGKSLVATVAMPETGIWAARFHQLDVGYIRSALNSPASLPGVISLRPDVTDPSGGLMGGTDPDGEVLGDKELTGSDTLFATVARLRMQESVEEMEEDYMEEDDYAKLFDEAEQLIEEDAAASDEDDE